MIETDKCERHMTIYDIGGESLPCKTCEQLIKDGYCKIFKSRRKEKEIKNNKDKIEYCGECIYIKLSNKSKKKITNGYSGKCKERNIDVTINTKACGKGIMSQEMKELKKRLRDSHGKFEEIKKDV